MNDTPELDKIRGDVLEWIEMARRQVDDLHMTLQGIKGAVSRGRTADAGGRELHRSTSCRYARLSVARIKAHLSEIQAAIERDGKDVDGRDLCPITHLEVIAHCFRAIVRGEEDIMKVLRRWRMACRLKSGDHATSGQPQTIAEQVLALWETLRPTATEHEGSGEHN